MLSRLGRLQLRQLPSPPRSHATSAARLLAHAAFPAAMPKAPVAVIGAGVIGLEVAAQLLEAGHAVAVLAQHLPGDQGDAYASPWAGAHWRTHASAVDTRQQVWDMATYASWLATAADEERRDVPEPERSGIYIRRSTLLWDSAAHRELQPSGRVDALWFRERVRDFRELDVASLPGVAVACTFTSLAVDVPKYLLYLESRVRALGGAVKRAKLPFDKGLDATLEHAASVVAEDTAPDSALASAGDRFVFVNACGLAAATLCRDGRVHPVRGQTVLVRGVSSRGIVTRQLHDPHTGMSKIAYAIPRVASGTTVLGGSADAHAWNTEEDVALTKRILQGARVLVPDLLVANGAAEKEFDVVSVQAGLRPAREGGARVEVETRDDGGPAASPRRSRTVVHAYGVGGAGFQNSIGLARDVVSLIRGMVEY